MGDIADMMLDGTLCEQCGCIMEDLIVPGQKELKAPPGHPRVCSDCRHEDKPRPGAWKKKEKTVVVNWRRADNTLSVPPSPLQGRYVITIEGAMFLIQYVLCIVALIKFIFFM